MKIIIKCCTLCCLLLLAAGYTRAQAPLQRVEYYIDNDPGFGKGTAVTLNGGTDLSNISVNINPANLSQGLHTFTVRARDTSGNWSLNSKWVFYKVSGYSIRRIEYYIDADPGYGKATTVAFTPGSEIADVNISINPTALTNGLHTITVRAQDSSNKWSLDSKWLFYKANSKAISRIEYYIDSDPGYGNATTVNFTPGSEDVTNAGFTIDPSLLTAGLHFIAVRSKDVNNKWSPDTKWLFIKQIAFNIVQAEYFIDTDPGYGKAVPVTFTPGADIADVNLSVNVSGIDTGVHKVVLRTKDATGKWSLNNSFSFRLPATQASPSIVVNSFTGKTYCAKDSLTVAFQATGTYNSGNQFKVQLSDSAGSFTAPVVIGTYTGTANNIINCVLPTHLNTGSRYKLRVVSTNPVVTGAASVDSLLLRDAPYAQTISGPGDANVLTSYTYSVPLVSGSAWAWIAGGATVVPTANSAVVTWNTAGTQQSVKSIETNQFGCKGDTSSKIVKVYTPAISNVSVSALTLCPGSSFTVSAKATGVYASGNIFKAQLSNASGGFGSPVNIGTLTSNPSGNLQNISISATLPVSTVNGSGYRVRVISTNPAVTSADNGQNISVPIPPTPVITPSGSTTFCQGGSITLTSTAATSYLWSTGATTQSITVSASGNYSVTVTNASGCSATSATTVVTVNAIPATPTISASGSTTLVCPGKTVTLTSSAGITYLWSTGATTQSIVVSTAGSYTVKVTNAAGCQSTSSAATVVTYNTCAKPTGLLTSNITATAAKLSWSAVTCAVGYQYEYRVKGTIPYTVGQVTGITKTITGLTAGTTYQWRVVTACKINPDTITSNGYTNGPEFTTLSAAFAGNDGGAGLDVKIGGLTASIMPNPARSMATVRVGNATGVISIKLTELSGKLLWQSKASAQNSFDIDVSRLAQGTYMILVSDDKDSQTLKLVRE